MQGKFNPLWIPVEQHGEEGEVVSVDVDMPKMSVNGDLVSTLLTLLHGATWK